jgi:murein DD-endopeptidase MepM/ murein hydrolase activator NlpD
MSWKWLILAVTVLLVGCNTESKIGQEENPLAMGASMIAKVAAEKKVEEKETPVVPEEVEEVVELVEEEKKEETNRHVHKKRDGKDQLRATSPVKTKEMSDVMEAEDGVEEKQLYRAEGDTEEYYKKLFVDNHKFLTDGFDFPVGGGGKGKANARGYYIAQKYLQNRHLGDDFNANTGGNTDLGDPVYAVANGFVTFAEDLRGGWGNTIRVVHRHPIGEMVESLYAHLDEIHINPGDFVKRGDQIGTIGNAHGMYLAHLHLEMRIEVDMPLGRGYSDHKAPPGYTAPTPFIRNNRPQW